MAQYYDASFLIQSQHVNFDNRYAPGAVALTSGIYRCKACGREIAIAKGQALPSRNEHEHPFEFGPVSWQLIVCPVSLD